MNIETLSDKWLQPLIGLVHDGEFSEAAALGEYYPDTVGNTVVRLAALLGTGDLDKAELVLKTLSIQGRPLVLQVLKDTNLDLVEIAGPATRDRRLELSRFMLEITLLKNPKSVQTVVNGLVLVAESALAESQLDFGQDLLNRLIDLDPSPARLLQYAEIALANRNPESRQWLTDLASNLVHRALNHLEPDDIENRLKSVRLLAIDDRMFDASCALARQIIHDHPEMKSRIADLFLPLIEYKLYFGDIADFILTISPGSIAQISQRLTAVRFQTSIDTYLNKAKSLLSAMDYVGLGYGAEFAQAVVTVGRATNSLEAYAEKYLVNFDFPSQIAIWAAKLLLKQRADLDLTSQLVEKALEDGSHRVEALEIYLRLADNSQYLLRLSSSKARCLEC